MRTFVTATVTAAALVVGAASAAAAPGSGGRHRVDTHGFGTYTIETDGSAAVTGTATGAPFDGDVVATLAAADGTLPEPGVCEQASATLRLTGTRGRVLALTSTDEVCGEYPDATYVVSHVFTGRYLVTESSTRRFLGTDGFLEVRLAVDGRASVFAIDT